MGYGPEDKNAVLELTYNYGVTEYDKGNGYAQVNSLPGAQFNNLVYMASMSFLAMNIFFDSESYYFTRLQ